MKKLTQASVRKQKTKNDQPITPEIDVTKSVSDLHEEPTKHKNYYESQNYLLSGAFASEPNFHDKYWRDLGHRMRRWAIENPRAYKLSRFLLREGLHPMAFKRQCAKDPLLDADRIVTLLAIGDNREVGGLERILDASIVKQTMARYDPEELAEEERRSKLRTENDGSSKAIEVVVMEKFPDTGQVPNRKTPEEVAGLIRKKTAQERN